MPPLRELALCFQSAIPSTVCRLNASMTNLKPVNVAIIGGGWSGLALANEVAGRTPQSVLVLERGIPRKTADYALDMDELDYAIRLRMMQNIADETITHRHSTSATAVPVRQYGAFLPGSGVGGAGEHWNGAAWRFLPELFRLRSHLNERHGSTRLPADLDVQDWGVTYDDLEPYYWRAEQMMGVLRKSRQSSRHANRRRRSFRGSQIARVSEPAT